MQPANNVQLTLALKSTVAAKIQRVNNVQLKALLLQREMDDKGSLVSPLHAIFQSCRDVDNCH